MSPPNGLPPGSDEHYLPLSTEEEETPIVENEEENIPEYSDFTKQEFLQPKTIEIDSEPELVVPPDGGWGWFVVVGSFFCNFVVDGIIFSFGVFLNEIIIDMEVPKASVAMMSSLLSGVYLICGPFASALANRYGFRKVGIIGSIVSAVAFVLSYFAPSIEILWFTYGILGGIGFGLVYVSAIVIVGFYFERWRALATSISVCGSGIGAFVLPQIFAPIIKYSGWRKALLAKAGIALSCGLVCLLFKPLKPTKLKELKDKEMGDKPKLVTDIDKLPVQTRMKMERALQGMRANSIEENQSTVPRILRVNNNADYPTAADLFGNKQVYHTVHAAPMTRFNVIHQKRLSVPLIPDDELPPKYNEGKIPLIQPKGLNSIIKTGRRNTITERHRSDHLRGRRGTLTSEINRPLYRDDIFFGASLTRLPQYTSNNSLSYNLTVTRLPTQNDIEEEKESKCALCPEAVRRTLGTMLDVSIFKSVTFNVMAFSGALTMMGFYIPYLFITSRATNNNLPDDVAVNLISVIGIANTVGRVIIGVLSSIPGVNALVVNNTALTIGAIATLLSGISFSAEYQYTYAAVFGLTISCFASLRSVLVVELLGLERLTNAFGLLLMFQGLTATIGGPLAGALGDKIGFYLSGSLILVSIIMCYPLNYIKKWEENRSKKLNSISINA